MTLTPADMRTACDGCDYGVGVPLPPVDDVFEEFVGQPHIGPALLTVRGFGFASAANAVVEIYGFAGDGVVQPSDMTAFGQLVHVTEPLSAVGPLPLIDVTAFVRAIAMENQPFIGFLFRDVVPKSDVSFGIENTISKLQVNVTPIPEPGSIWLIGCGSVWFVILALRNRDGRLWK